ncbi:TetR/AcrR family transcriptional regulator [Roseomonas sp. KE2513]|uniref:TetR/AcrR family transcriptional regulator n=1 Tax=Roseomonas sp. KE2513 TaxID=2479202 RepID=UPI0018DF78CE|nr:TetR/AcrR family transcriptional regulator [Roseomonas sp. KE2513]MBI0537677.1 TetR/AcrR family transcriptional regulator [Roseomonas sp. KE2513]
MPGPRAATPPAEPRRPRIAAAERERMIVDAAIGFFAEEGFSGQTRQLAQSIGISHSVLYRHFPGKEELIATVCAEMFERRWREEWTEILRDPAPSLEERLLRFYREAGTLLLSPEWMRIAVMTGLSGAAAPSGLSSLLHDRIIRPIADAIQATCADRPLPRDVAEQRAWALHGRVFYLGARGAIWRGATPRSQDAALAAAIAGFCRGARALTEAEA